MTKGLVSIISPVYNSASFVAETIDSVLSQTYTQWEMLLVDDGSNDNSAEIINKYAEQDSRIKLIRQQNGGSANARNNGIRHAEGQYIAFLDSDDIWTPQFIEKQLSFMKEKKASIAFSSYYRIDEFTKKELLTPFIAPSEVTHSSLLFTDPIFPSTLIYDREQNPTVYFKEEWKSMRDDYVFMLELVPKGKIAYGNKEKLVYYRMRKSSMTADKKKVIIPQWNVLRKAAKLSLPSAAFHIFCWAFISYFKYRK